MTSVVQEDDGSVGSASGYFSEKQEIFSLKQAVLVPNSFTACLHGKAFPELPFCDVQSWDI